jgi:hypothetical protein
MFCIFLDEKIAPNFNVSAPAGKRAQASNGPKIFPQGVLGDITIERSLAYGSFR